MNRVIIAGTRDIEDMHVLEFAVEAAGFRLHQIVCGGARGIDHLGADYGMRHGIPVKGFPAFWRERGVFNPRAGHERNERMAAYASHLIAVWDGWSPGTRDMIARAQDRCLFVYVQRVERVGKGWRCV